MNDTERNNQILKAVSSIPIEKEGADLTLVPALLKEQLLERGPKSLKILPHFIIKVKILLYFKLLSAYSILSIISLSVIKIKDVLP